MRIRVTVSVSLFGFFKKSKKSKIQKKKIFKTPQCGYESGFRFLFRFLVLAPLVKQENPIQKKKISSSPLDTKNTSKVSKPYNADTSFGLGYLSFFLWFSFCLSLSLISLRLHRHASRRWPRSSLNVPCPTFLVLNTLLPPLLWLSTIHSLPTHSFGFRNHTTYNHTRYSQHLL